MKKILEGAELSGGEIVVIPHRFTSELKFDYEIYDLPNDSKPYVGDEGHVFVLGGVRVPGKYPFNPNYTIARLVSLAGGTTKLATKRVTVSRFRGPRISTTISDLMPIYPGDTVEVYERTIAPEFWLTFLTTLASVGLSAVAILR